MAEAICPSFATQNIGDSNGITVGQNYVYKKDCHIAVLFLVDAEEFESPTPSTSMRCSSQLSYASILDVL